MTNHAMGALTSLDFFLLLCGIGATTISETPILDRGLAVACLTTDRSHTCSNLGVGIAEGCFILDSASLPFGGRSAHLGYLVDKSGLKTSIIIISSCGVIVNV